MTNLPNINSKLDGYLRNLYELAYRDGNSGTRKTERVNLTIHDVEQLLLEARLEELKHLEGGTDYWLANGEVTTVNDRIEELKALGAEGE